MLAKSDPKWKRFERLVEQIQRTLTPDADVRFDDKIMGNLSQTLRQFDVTVRQGDLLTVFDCKDYKKPVDVKDAEQFIGMVADVRANRAVIVSAKGFSKPAVNRGKAAGFDLFTVMDAEKHDWHTAIFLPVLEECWVVESKRWRTFSFALDRLIPDLENNYRAIDDVLLYDVGMKPLGTARELLNRRIAEDAALRVPGIHDQVEIHAGPTFAKATDGEVINIGLQGDIRVREDLFLHTVPLTHLKGFRDVVTEGIRTRLFVTEWIDANNVAETTVKIPHRNMLAVRPIFIFTTSQNTL